MVVLVANVLLSLLDAAEEPSDASNKGLYKVPEVHGVPDCSEATALGLVGVLDGGTGDAGIRYGVKG